MVTIRLLNTRRIYHAVRVLLTHPGNLGQLYRRYSAIYLSAGEERNSLPSDNNESQENIIFFPVIDWHFRFQRPQHLASQLAKTGYRVFYLSTTPLIANQDTAYVIQESPVENVFIVQLSSGGTRLPDFYRDTLNDQEVIGFSSALHQLINDFTIHSPVAIVQHPIWYKVLEAKTWRSIIYDCIDHHAGFLEIVPPGLVKQEQDLIERANIVSVSSEKLHEDVSKTRPCTIIRNGCEFSRFSTIPRQKSINPTIGYVGAIATWFDDELVTNIAAAKQDWNFVMVGSTMGANIAKLRKLPNVSFIGEIEYQEVPQYLSSFDVCLIPFKLIPLTEATNPVKVYEYLAAGRPVVATDLPELHNMQSLDVFTSSTPEHFISQLKHALQISDQPERIKLRKNWAEKNDWSSRAAQLHALIPPISIPDKTIS